MAGAPLKDQTQYVTLEIPGNPDPEAWEAFKVDVETVLRRYQHTVKARFKAITWEPLDRAHSRPASAVIAAVEQEIGLEPIPTLGGVCAH